MVTFIKLGIGDKQQMTSISAIRVDYGWNILGSYEAIVKSTDGIELKKSTVAEAILPALKMINNNDRIIFQNQLERDVFISIAKRHAGIQIGKKAYVCPTSICPKTDTTLRAMVKTLSQSGIAVAEVIARA